MTPETKDHAILPRRAHEAPADDAGFRQQVQTGLEEADQPDAVLIPHEAVMADLKGHLDRLAARAAQSRCS